MAEQRKSKTAYQPNTTRQEREQQDSAAPDTPLRETLHDAVSSVQERAESLFRSRRRHTADVVQNLAEAVYGAGRHLRGAEQEPMARLTDAIGDQIQGVSSFLRDRETSKMLHAVEDFARQKPMIFVAAAFVLGFSAARFLKAGPEKIQILQAPPETGNGAQVPAADQEPRS